MRLSKLSTLTPGDFATVVRQARALGTSYDAEQGETYLRICWWLAFDPFPSSLQGLSSPQALILSLGLRLTDLTMS